MATWGEDLQRTQGACEVWKKEATLANKKAELALKQKDEALLKLAQMQKEIDNLSGGPLLHVIRRVQDLKTAPMGVLKTIEWQLRKDLQEVEKVRDVRVNYDLYFIFEWQFNWKEKKSVDKRWENPQSLRINSLANSSSLRLDLYLA